MSNETVEQRATRRRWINLAELVAVAGLVIGALSLWLTWSDRRESAAEKAASSAIQARAAARVELGATVTNGGRTLALADAKHDLSDVTIAYPKALGIAAQRPAGEPVIDSAVFASVLLKLTDGGAATRAGRLPALVTVRYVDGDATRAATGVYDVVWRTEGRFLRGRTLRLTGLRLRQRGGGQAAVDAAWAREKP